MSLRQRRNALEDKLQHVEWFLKGHPQRSNNGSVYDPNMSLEDVKKLRDQLEKEREEVALEHRYGLKKHHETFHPVWGR